jgi:phage gp36-like protein
MPWITITDNDVLARITDDERDSIEEVGESGVSPAKRLPGIIRQVTAMIRGKVAACSDNRGRLGPSGTIPEECLYHACTICRDSLVASQPTPEGVTDPRKEELRQAYAYLNQVASCEVAIADNSGNYPGEPIDPLPPAIGGCPLLGF